MTKGRDAKGGVQAVVDMFNVMEPEERKRLLAELAERDPALVEEIERRIFVFEDLPKLEPLALQALLKEVHPTRLALALKKAPDEVQGAIFGNMSERAAKLLKEEIESQGPKRLSDVQAAQTEIARIALKIKTKA